MKDWKNRIVCGQTKEVLRTMPDESIDCCITSPPYYGLRDYGVQGQIGLEASPEEYVANLADVFREVRRVLKEDGTLWLNLGDSYAGSGKGSAKDAENAKKYKQGTCKGMLGQSAVTTTGMGACKPKDLMGIPWMVAFALRADGWYLRQDIIWSKTNCMPESVKDRCTKSHEYIFLFSKSRKYYFDSEAIKEPAVGFNNIDPAGSLGTIRPNSRRRKGNNKTFRGGGAYTMNQSFYNSAIVEKASVGNKPNESGFRNRRSVWNIASAAYKGAHFATFPLKLIEPCILAGSRVGGVVLDPFIGSGTTAVCAVQHERKYVGIELNPEYAKMAEERIERCKA